MIRMTKSLTAWPTPVFNAVLKDEIEHLDAGLLPLQEALSQSSQANLDTLTVMILNVAEEPDCLRVKAGLFYTGIIAGCSCADDPTPVDEVNEYCEVRLDIDKKTAETTVTLLSG
jgi:hypothetical protein